MLTDREAQTLRFIAAHIEQHWVAPLFREIAAATGLRSKSRVHTILCALEAKGCIERQYRRHQAIAILCWPQPRYFRWVRTSADHGELIELIPRQQGRQSLPANWRD